MKNAASSTLNCCWDKFEVLAETNEEFLGSFLQANRNIELMQQAQGNKVS